jgi:type III pantothenate kinase
MLLAIDVGNTNITLGLFSGEELSQDWRIETAARRTSDEYGLLVTQLLQNAGFERGDIDAVIIASVVPSLTPHLESFSQTVLGLKAQVVGPGLKTGMPIRYDPPKDVGADRIVNGVAAFHRYQSACIVVDFGTATTFDSISSQGGYQGGAIAPGVKISMEVLFQRAAKLPKVDFRRPKHVVGKSTVESIQSGAYFGYVALVDGLVARMKSEMGDEIIHVIATGGLATEIAEQTHSIECVDLHLTLDGLRLIHELNNS